MELQKVMQNRKMIYNKNDYEVFIPCTYNGSETEIRKFEDIASKKKLYFIDNYFIILILILNFEIL